MRTKTLIVILRDIAAYTRYSVSEASGMYRHYQTYQTIISDSILDLMHILK